MPKTAHRSILPQNQPLTRNSRAHTKELQENECIFIKHPEWHAGGMLTTTQIIALLIYEFGARGTALNPAQIANLLPVGFKVSNTAIKKGHLVKLHKYGLIEGTITQGTTKIISHYTDVYEIDETNASDWLNNPHFKAVLEQLREQVKQPSAVVDASVENLTTYLSNNRFILAKNSATHQSNIEDIIFSIIATCEIKGFRFPTITEIIDYINKHKFLGKSVRSKIINTKLEEEVLLVLINRTYLSIKDRKIIRINGINHEALATENYNSYRALYNQLKIDLDQRLFNESGGKSIIPFFNTTTSTSFSEDSNEPDELNTLIDKYLNYNPSPLRSIFFKNTIDENILGRFDKKLQYKETDIQKLTAPLTFDFNKSRESSAINEFSNIVRPFKY